MSKTDRDRLVAGRENRGFSYTEESGDGKEGGKGLLSSPSVNDEFFFVWGGERISARRVSQGRLTCRLVF